MGEPVSLRLGTAHLPELAQLLLGLHAFGDDVHAQRLPERHHGLHHGAAAAGVQAAHERAIDLQGLVGEALEVGERGVSRAEVVHVHLNPELAQLPEPRQREITVIHDGILGDIQAQALRRQPALIEDRPNALRHARLHEQLAGNVDADVERRVGGKAFLPAAHLPARLAQRPPLDGHDDVLLLREGQKAVRAHQALLGVIPAKQPFQTHDAPAVERNDGLVMHEELLALHRPAQLGLEPHRPHLVLVESVVEDLVTGLARRLGPVHGEVGVAQHLLGALVSIRSERDADARRGEHLVPADDEGLRQQLVNAHRHVGRIGDARHIGEQHGELVAPESRERVPGAQKLLQPVRDAHEQLVPGAVPEAVVHVLEAIQVEEQHGEKPILVAAVLAQREIQSVEEQSPVGQAREAVVHGVVQQLLLGAFARADVGERAGHAIRCSRLVPDRQTAAQHPQVSRGLGVNPMLVHEVVGSALQMRVQRSLQSFDVRGVHAVEPLGEIVADVSVLISQHGLPAR